MCYQQEQQQQYLLFNNFIIFVSCAIIITCYILWEVCVNFRGSVLLRSCLRSCLTVVNCVIHKQLSDFLIAICATLNVFGENFVNMFLFNVRDSLFVLQIKEVYTDYPLHLESNINVIYRRLRNTQCSPEIDHNSRLDGLSELIKIYGTCWDIYLLSG